MNSSILYNFRNDVEDDISLKINMEELYEKKPRPVRQIFMLPNHLKCHGETLANV